MQIYKLLLLFIYMNITKTITIDSKIADQIQFIAELQQKKFSTTINDILKEYFENKER